MTHQLKHRQEKIQAKRKNTPWREFVMEICSWYNLSLYSNNNHISRYPSVSRNKNLTVDVMKSMSNDLTHDYGGDFLSNFAYFYQQSEKGYTLHFGTNENCDYTDSCYGAKDCYLSFGLGWNVVNGLYSGFVARDCDTIINTISATYNCSCIFSSRNIKKSFNVFYSANIYSSSNIWFSSNLIGCTECINCDSLENQSYCINNKQFSRSEYMQLKDAVLQHKDKFLIYKNKALSRMSNINSKHVEGSGILSSQYIEHGYFVFDASYARNIFLFEGGESGSQHFYDGIDVGIDSHDLYANCQAGTNSSHMYCCVFVGMSSHCFYSMNLDSCSYCLGCIGLKNKSYCIFNKQYTKEERHKKVDEIFTQMEKDGDLGKFFPGSMNPFYFNDTAAYLIDDSFTKEEVEAAGYLRRDEAISVDIPAGATVVKTSELDRYEGWIIDGTFTSLADGGTWTEGASRSIDPEILKVIIQDEQGNVYRVVQMEYDFLLKHGLPLPRTHRLDRMKQHFSVI